MASTISTINESLVDQRVVEALRYVLPMFDSFSYRVERSGRIQNDSLYVPIATDPSAQSKTPGSMVTANGTITGTQVQLSNFYGASWNAVEGSMASNLFAQYWADKAAGAVYSLAKQVVDAALGLITSGNFGNTEGTDKLTVAVADFGQLDLALLWGYAEAKIKQRQKSLGLNASYSAAMFGDSSVTLVNATAGQNMLASGTLPRMMGMNTWTYAGFPANAQSLGGAIIGKAALLVAVAPPDPLAAAGDGDIVERRLITEPNSGISVLYSMSATAAGTVSGECCLLYGVAKGQDAVVRLVSA